MARGRGCAVRLPGTSPPSLMGFSVFIAHVYKDPSPRDSAATSLRLNSSLHIGCDSLGCFTRVRNPARTALFRLHRGEFWRRRASDSQAQDKRVQIFTDKSEEIGKLGAKIVDDTIKSFYLTKSSSVGTRLSLFGTVLP